MVSGVVSSRLFRCYIELLINFMPERLAADVSPRILGSYLKASSMCYAAAASGMRNSPSDTVVPVQYTRVSWGGRR